MKKRNQCWRKGCEKSYTVQFKLKFEVDKARVGIEGKFCDEHFEQGWHDSPTGAQSMVDAFIEKRAHPHMPKALAK